MQELFDEPSRKPLPEPDLAELGYVGLKAVSSLIPTGGELFGLLTSPLARRRDEWLTDLERRLHDLEAKVEGFRFEDLGKNEQFVSATLQATRAALTTHHKEKREALRNAVLNVALRPSIDEDEQAMFIRYVEELTPWHLRILHLFQDPIKCIDRAGATGRMSSLMGSVSQTVGEAFPEIRGNRDFYSQIVRDLHTRGFSSVDESVLHTMMTPAGALAKRTTELGDRFLCFISLPKEAQE